MIPAGSGQAFFVVAGLAISILPPSVAYDALWLLQPAEPVSTPPSTNDAMISVPPSTLVTASPCRSPVACHEPTGVAGR